METLTDIKRRVQVGTRLLCVENTKRPELSGTHRIVTKVQGNAFVWKLEPGHPGTAGWTYWEKAADIEIIDADTFRMRMGGMPAWVTLRFEVRD